MSRFSISRMLLLAVVVSGVTLAITDADGAKTAKVPPDKKATVSFGKAQAATHKAGVTAPPLVPFIRTLSFTKKSNAGCVAANPGKHIVPTCPAIFQMQRALKAAKFRPVHAKATGVFGKSTRDQIRAFQRAKKIPPSGIYGSRTHKALTRYYDLTGRRRLQQVAKDRKAQAVTAAFTTVAYHFARVGGTTLTYSQSSSRGNLGHYPGIPPATDCSGFVTAIYKAVGQPDPNGFGYSPVGYTGTLALHGVRVGNWSDLHVGDLVFYGGGFPYGHVTMVVDAKRRLVISHGSRGVRIVAYNYRPVSAIRRYTGTA